MAKIHPTAIIHPSARLSEEVEVRPYAVIESDVQIGPGTVIGEHCAIRRYTQIGSGNMLDAYVALGGLPQDLKFNPQTVTYLRIGDNNVFREGVTISRATVAAFSSWSSLCFVSMKTARIPSPRYLTTPPYLNTICVAW